MCGIVNQIHSPIFVYDGPTNNAGMISVAIHNTAKGLPFALAGMVSRKSDIWQFCPDEQTQSVRHLVIPRVGGLYVETKAIEAKLFRFAKLILQKSYRGNGA